MAARQKFREPLLNLFLTVEGSNFKDVEKQYIKHLTACNAVLARHQLTPEQKAYYLKYVSNFVAH